MTRNLSRLLMPKSIALFGGSWAENVIRQLQKSGFTGNIWPVHPNRETVAGLQCYRNLSELPSPPDASFIGVNRDLTIEIVAELSRSGAGGATCFASGFLESEEENTGGANLQNRLIKAAGNMPVLGPNCYGLINYLDDIALWPDQHGGRKVDRGVAIIGQSSNVLINMTMQKRGLPISHVIAVGNQAQTGMAEIADCLLEDPRVTALGLYIEGFGDIRKLDEISLKAKELGKPIVAIKVGKSEKSRQATLTHTASLAGNAAASSALMKRLGIVEVSSVAVFLETLKLLHVCGPLHGNQVSSMSCSGGEAGLVADMSEGTRISFRGFSEKQYRAIKDVLGPLVTVSNPLDYHTFIWSDEEKLYRCYKAVMDDGFDLNMLIMDLPHETRCDAEAWQAPLRAIKRARQETGANTALLATLPENMPEHLADDLLAAGIVPLQGMEEIIQAVDAAIRAGDASENKASPVMLYPLQEHSRQTLDEHQSKLALSKHGLKFPKNATAENADQIADAASKLHYPLALKGLGIAHKTEAGAVQLDIQNPQQLEMAARNMSQASGFLAEEMVPDPVAEILVGVSRDETGMFVLTVGTGGIMTELMSDTVSLLVPTERQDILKAMEGLKLTKVLAGYRGKPAADIEAVLDAIEAVQSFCIANPDLIELDINPLMALEAGTIAVDALIVKEKTK